MSSRLAPGLPVTVAAEVTRIVAPNPSLMTGPGTNSYVLGARGAVIIDPGPAIEAHALRLREQAPGLAAVLVTHTHSDHSPGAALLAATGEVLRYGRPPPPGRHQDATFVADRVLEDGERLTIDDVTLRVLHTPGHASNHLCFLRETDGLLFTGDHVINGSTVVIDPPDGDMSAYLAALGRLGEVGAARIAPGHGELIDAPLAEIERLIAHRLERERKVADALGNNPGEDLAALTAIVYAEVDAVLHPVAARSLLAHLEKLERDGRARRAGEAWWPVAGGALRRR